MKKISFLVLLMLFAISIQAQKDRYRFAQTYIGAQADVVGGSATPEFLSGRFLIGGTHFWQKADFYISFPLFTTSMEDTESEYSEGVITGFRYLPFGLSRSGPRPFFGLQWLTPDFRMGDGPQFERSRFGLEAGLSIAFGSLYTLEVSAHHVLNQDLYYPITREASSIIRQPDFGLSLALKKYFDTTSGLSSPESKAMQNKRYDDFENRGKLSTWNFGVGLSANVSTSDLSVLDPFEFMPNRPPLAIYPDVVAGYYFHELDAGIRASWRPMKLSDGGYGLEYAIRQHRLGFEVFKFLFDYKGFVPFIGMTAGMDFIDFELTDIEGTNTSDRYDTFSYGIVFGWDIRTTETDPYILRTNLRYVVQTDPKSGSLNASGNHLEINFIQIVLYPGRWN